MPRIWIDATTLLNWTGRPTGIPRVLSQLLANMKEQRKLDVRVCRFAPARGAFVQVKDGLSRLAGGGNSRHKPGRVQRLHYHWSMTARRIREGQGIWRRLVPQEMRPALADATLASLRMAGAMLAMLRRSLAAVARSRSRNGSIFERGDVLLALGMSWMEAGYSRAVVEQVKATEVHFVPLIYDMIPWRCPQYSRSRDAAAYVDWAIGVLSVSSLVLTISNHSRDDIRAFCDEYAIPCPAVEVLRLGDDLIGAAKDEPVEATDELVPDGPFVLCVGTLEARKNHLLLYYVWRRLVAEFGDSAPRLVLVGRRGLLADDVLYQATHDPLTREHVIVLENVSDVQLAGLYGQCLFTVFPSHYEGWGLPVCESLYFGKHCIASSSSSMTEAGGQWAEFHDPIDVRRCYELVRRAAFDEDHRNLRETTIREHYRPVSWNECAQSLVSLLTWYFGEGASPVDHKEHWGNAAEGEAFASPR